MSTLDQQMIAERQHFWHNFSRVLFWAALHAAIFLIVVVMFAVDGPTADAVIVSILLVGANIAVTAGYFLTRRS